MRRHGLVAALLVSATAVVFAQTASFEFLTWDDGQYVRYNDAVRAGLSLETIRWAFTTFHAGNWHPLTWLSLALDFQLFGEDAGAFHLVNVLFHGLSALILYGVFAYATGSVWRSAFVAAAFAIHPQHVESVAWISERKDVLCAWFWMLSMFAYVDYARRGGKVRYGAMWVCATCAMLAKPMAVTLPFVLLLMDVWPLGRLSASETPQRRRDRARLLMEKLPLVLPAVGVAALTVLAQRAESAVVAVEHLPWSVRLANTFVAYASYLVRTVWPQNLAFFYPYPHAGPGVWSALGAVLLLGGLTLFFQRKRAHSHLLVGWLWYLGTLVPVIGLIQVGAQASADRYTYIPLIGIFLILGWSLPRAAMWRRVAASAAAIWLVAMTAAAHAQAGKWANSERLFRHAVAATRNNHVAHEQLAGVLLDGGKMEESAVQAAKALQVLPSCPLSHALRGVALARTGRYAEALPYLARARSAFPDHVELLLTLASTLVHLQRLTEADDLFLGIVERWPGHPGGHTGRAVVNRMREAGGAVDPAVLQTLPIDAFTFAGPSPK